MYKLSGIFLLFLIGLICNCGIFEKPPDPNNDDVSIYDKPPQFDFILSFNNDSLILTLTYASDSANMEFSYRFIPSGYTDSLNWSHWTDYLPVFTGVADNLPGEHYTVEMISRYVGHDLISSVVFDTLTISRSTQTLFLYPSVMFAEGGDIINLYLCTDDFVDTVISGDFELQYFSADMTVLNVEKVDDSVNFFLAHGGTVFFFNHELADITTGSTNSYKNYFGVMSDGNIGAFGSGRILKIECYVISNDNSKKELKLNESTFKNIRNEEVFPGLLGAVVF